MNTECNVVCSELDACKNTVIHGLTTDTIKLTCNAEDYSCRDTVILGTNVETIIFNCDKVRCFGVDIHADNATTANITCFGVDASGTNTNGCDSGMYYLNYANDINIYCIGYKSLVISDTHRSCFNNDYFLPVDLSGVNLYCYGVGCHTGELNTQSLMLIG